MSLKRRLKKAEIRAQDMMEKQEDDKEYFETWQEPLVKIRPEAGKLIARLSNEAGTRDARSLIFHKYSNSALEKAKEKLHDTMVSYALQIRKAPVAKVIRYSLQPPPVAETRFVLQPETQDLMLFLA